VKKFDGFVRIDLGAKSVMFDEGGDVLAVTGGNEDLDDFERSEATEKFKEYVTESEIKQAHGRVLNVHHKDPDFRAWAENVRYELEEDEIEILQTDPLYLDKKYSEYVAQRGPSPEQEAAAAREKERVGKRVEKLQAEIKERGEKGWSSDDQLMELMELGNIFPAKE